MVLPEKAERKERAHARQFHPHPAAAGGSEHPVQLRPAGRIEAFAQRQHGGCRALLEPGERGPDLAGGRPERGLRTLRARRHRPRGEFKPQTIGRQQSLAVPQFERHRLLLTRPQRRRQQQAPADAPHVQPRHHPAEDQAGQQQRERDEEDVARGIVGRGSDAEREADQHNARHGRHDALGSGRVDQRPENLAPAPAPPAAHPRATPVDARICDFSADLHRWFLASKRQVPISKFQRMRKAKSRFCCWDFFGVWTFEVWPLGLWRLEFSARRPIPAGGWRRQSGEARPRRHCAPLERPRSAAPAPAGGRRPPAPVRARPPAPRNRARLAGPAPVPPA